MGHHINPAVGPGLHKHTFPGLVQWGGPWGRGEVRKGVGKRAHRALILHWWLLSWGIRPNSPFQAVRPDRGFVLPPLTQIWPSYASVMTGECPGRTRVQIQTRATAVWFSAVPFHRWSLVQVKLIKWASPCSLSTCVLHKATTSAGALLRADPGLQQRLFLGHC